MATESYKQMISECLIQYTKQPKGASTRAIENFLKQEKSLMSPSRPAMKKALANGLESEEFVHGKGGDQYFKLTAAAVKELRKTMPATQPASPKTIKKTTKKPIKRTVVENEVVLEEEAEAEPEAEEEPEAEPEKETKEEAEEVTEEMDAVGRG